MEKQLQGPDSWTGFTAGGRHGRRMEHTMEGTGGREGTSAPEMACISLGWALGRPNHIVVPDETTKIPMRPDPGFQQLVVPVCSSAPARVFDDVLRQAPTQRARRPRQ